MGGWQAQEGLTVEAHAVPWWCFDVYDRDAWPTTQRRWAYAGIEHDAVSLGAALSESLADAAEAQPLEAVSASQRPIEIEDATLSAGTAWEVVLSEDPASRDAAELRAVALVYMPAWRVSYTYLGVPLTAWTCGRTGLTDGINCRGLGSQFFEDWLPKQHAFWERAAPWVREFDRMAAEDPRSANAAFTAASRVAGLGAASVFRLGARVASRHPKVFLASLIAPYVALWAKPVIESGVRAAQAQLRASRARRDEHDAAALDARADWEHLLQRGEQRLRAQQAPDGAKHGGGTADKERVVDFRSPRSVLGLPASGRVSPRTLERAFRRELLAWHPDRTQRAPAAQAAAAERTRAILGAYKAMRQEVGQGG